MADDSTEVLSLSVCIPVWLEEVQKGYDQDPHSSQLVAQLTLKSDVLPHFSLESGILRYKGRVWIGANPHVQSQILQSLHAGAVDGHSGVQITYSHIKRLFAWTGLRKAVKTVANCTVCQQAKTERVRYPGLLQPLAFCSRFLFWIMHGKWYPWILLKVCRLPRVLIALWWSLISSLNMPILCL